jgi:hypothetical protein
MFGFIAGEILTVAALHWSGLRNVYFEIALPGHGHDQSSII